MVKRGEYQGKPVISLMKGENDKYPFTFGINKAQLILANISEIQSFVKENEEKNVPTGTDNTTGIK